MALLVGSMALAANGYTIRDSNDQDYIIRPEELKVFVEDFRPSQVTVLNENHVALFGTRAQAQSIVELELAWPGSSAAAILDTELGNWEKISGTAVASLYALYWLKMSHRYKKNSPHFLKTRNDITFLRGLGINIRTPPVWYKQREKETYDYGHPNLQAGQSKTNFFGTAEESGTGMAQGIQYFFNHDWVHEVVSKMYGGEVPAYTLYQKDGEAVACDRGKFDTLPFTERLRGVMEEATVLALERSQIPARLDPVWRREGRNPAPEWSFQHALEKVCTSITSGWFREFAWENYDGAIRDYRHDYADKFWEACGYDGRTVLM
jgi:hypothetical protein